MCLTVLQMTKKTIKNLIAILVLVWTMIVVSIMLVVEFVGCAPLYLIKPITQKFNPENGWRFTQWLNTIVNRLSEKI